MEVTDIRMRLINDRTDRLKAFCTVTFDGEFVIRDVKVVEGPDGFFIAMPSRKLSAACPGCRHKNQVRARFCEECGQKLKPQALPRDPAARTRLYRDIAHPITPEFREKLQTCVIDAYRTECENLPEEEEFESEVEFGGETDSPDEPFTSADQSQYDTLIAGLNNGAEPPAAKQGESSHTGDRGDQERPRGEETDSPHRGRRRGRRRRGERAGEPRAETPERETSPSEKDAAPEDLGPDEPMKDPTLNQPPAADVQPPPPAKSEPETVDRVGLSEAVDEQTGSEDASEDTATPFGAGIA